MSLEFTAGRPLSSTTRIPPFRGLSISVHPSPPANAGVVTVHGEVDATSAGLLADRIAHARLWFDTVVVDLSGVTFFAAAGLEALAADGPIALVCSPAVLKVLTACGLETRWELHRSVFLALAAGVSLDFATASPEPSSGAHRGVSGL
jgi:anti-anti-sigma regulatory factor